MNTIWIINDCDEATELLRGELYQLGIEGPFETIACDPQLLERTLSVHAPGGVMMLTVAAVTEQHFQLVRELRNRTQSKIVVLARLLDSVSAMELFRAGCVDVLDSQSNLRQGLTRLVSRLNAESSQNSTEGRMLTVLPADDQSDANVLAVSLAAEVSGSQGCALIDLHLTGGDLADYLRVSPQYTIYDLLMQHDEIDETMIDQAMAAHSSGIRLLASPPHFRKLDGVDVRRCMRILQHANQNYPFTIIKLDHPRYPEQLRAIEASQQVLVTLRLNIISVTRAQRTLRFLRENGVPQDFVTVVAMRCNTPGELPASEVRRVLKVPRFFMVPDDPTGINVSMNVGNPLVIESPHSVASEKIRELASALTRGSNPPQRSAEGLADKVAGTFAIFRQRFGQIAPSGSPKTTN